MSRPSKRTDATVNKIVKSIEAGAFAHVAAQAAGIGRSTFYRWLDEDAEFRDKVEAAAARARLKAEALVFRDKPMAWLRYGPGKTKVDAEGWTEPTKVELSGPGGSPLNSGPDLSRLSTEELEQLHRLRLKAEGSSGDSEA